MNKKDRNEKLNKKVKAVEENDDIQIYVKR